MKWWGLFLDLALWPLQWLLQHLLKPLPSHDAGRSLIFIYESGFPAHWPARILQKRFAITLFPMTGDEPQRLEELLRQMEKPVVLLGHGRGGLVAAAVDHPIVETIVTINTPWAGHEALSRSTLICFGSRFDPEVPWASSFSKGCQHAIMHPFGHTSVGFFPTLWQQVGRALASDPSCR